MEEQLRVKEEEARQITSEMDTLHKRNARLERQLEEGLQANQAAFEDAARLKRDIKVKEEELQAAQDEVLRLSKLNEAAQKKLQSSEETRSQLTEQRDQARNEAASLARELEALRKQVEQDRKRLEELARTRDMLGKKMLQAGKETEVQEALVKMHENTAKSLEQEIATYREEGNRQRKTISQLEKERDRYGGRAWLLGVAALQCCWRSGWREVGM